MKQGIVAEIIESNSLCYPTPGFREVTYFFNPNQIFCPGASSNSF